MKKKFSDSWLKGLKPEPDQKNKKDFREGKGFGLRLMPTGAKTFFFMYHFDSKRRFMNLGTYPTTSLKQANENYRVAASLLEQGKDPIAVREQEESARRAEKDVAWLVKEYMENYAQKKKVPRSLYDDQRTIDMDVLPHWGKKSINSIRRQDAIDLVNLAIKRGSPGQARNIFKLMRAIWNYAVQSHYAEFNPFDKMTKILPAIAPVQRKRVLNDKEIYHIWKKITPAGFGSEEVRRAIKLILITCQRPGEVITMHSDDIDGDWWTVPIERTKYKEDIHRVYLTPLAKKIIGKKKGWIFESPKPVREEGKPPKTKPMTENAISRVINRELESADQKFRKEKYYGLPEWTPHDLRRTGATNLAMLGASNEVIDAILSHKVTGVVGVYNLYKYDTQKKEFLALWSERLMDILKKKRFSQGQNKGADGKAA